MEEQVKEEKRIPKTLNEKILELKKIVSIMKKNSEGHGYNFVNEESILLAINDKMIEFGLKLTPCIVPGTLHSEIVNYKNSKGQDKTDVLVRSEMQFTWEDIFTKEKEIINWGLVGQQADGSQALGSGLTYSNRYFLLKYFNVATSENDPDKIRSEMQAEEERKKLSSIQTKIKKTLEKLMKKYQTQENIYNALNTTKEKFLEDYKNKDRWNDLLEQMELVLKEDKDVNK